MIPAIAVCIAIPVVMFSAMGYEINIAFLLAPLVAYAFFSLAKTREAMLYAAAAIAGVASILAAEAMMPDGEMLRHLLSLSLILISASFYFLGRWLGSRTSITQIVWWLGVASAIFVIPVAVRILLLGEDFRAYSFDGNFVILNAVFLGDVAFGAFGANTLGNLLALQTAIITAALWVPGKPRWVSAILWLALLMSSYLAFASESRSSQIGLLVLIIGICAHSVLSREKIFKKVATALVIIAGIFAAAVLNNAQSRTLDMLGLQAHIPHIKNPGLITRSPDLLAGGDPSKVIAPGDRWANRPPPASFLEGDVSNGRVHLWTSAINDFRSSPVFGTGFGGFQRFNDTEFDSTLADNSSAHNFYITVFWKGGLLFGIPFILFMAGSAFAALKSLFWRCAVGAYTGLGVIILFGPLALLWEILGTPSAGALGWFLLGSLGGIGQRASVPSPDQLPVNSLRSSHPAPV